MDKVAIISDIHGNIPALEAVLGDIRTRGIKRIFCLGDLVGKGPQSSEAIALVRESCEKVVRGNWDDFITKQQDSKFLQWFQERLTEEDQKYLDHLPFSFEFMMSGRLIRLFHASPRSVYERIQAWDTMEKRLSLFECSTQTSSLQADVVVYGDIHYAYMQNLKGKILCNSGSVGNPLDEPQASYVIFEGMEGAEKTAPFSMQFVRVPYDIQSALKIAKEMELPELDAYTLELTKAKYRGSK